MATPGHLALLQSALGFAPPRLVLIPPGARSLPSPPGLHRVGLVAAPGGAANLASDRGVSAAAAYGVAYVVVPAGAADKHAFGTVPAATVTGGSSTSLAAAGLGSGSFRAMSLVAKAADGAEAKVEGNDEALFKLVVEQGLSAIDLLSETVPPAHLVKKASELKAQIATAVDVARAGTQDKVECATGMLRLMLKISVLAHECYPGVAGMSRVQDAERFVAFCLDIAKKEADPLEFGPAVGERDAMLMKAVLLGLTVVTCETRFTRDLYYKISGNDGTLP